MRLIPRAYNYAAKNLAAAKKLYMTLLKGSGLGVAAMPVLTGALALLDSDNPLLEGKNWYQRFGTGWYLGTRGIFDAGIRTVGAGARGVLTAATKLGNIGRTLAGNGLLNLLYNKNLANALQGSYDVQNKMLRGPSGKYKSSWFLNLQHAPAFLVRTGINAVTDPVSLVTAAVLPMGSSSWAVKLPAFAANLSEPIGTLASGADALSGGKGRVVTKPTFSIALTVSKPRRSLRDMLGIQAPLDIGNASGIINVALKDKQATPFLLSKFDDLKLALKTADALRTNKARIFGINGVNYTALKDTDVASLGAPVLDLFGPDTDVLRDLLKDVLSLITKRVLLYVIPLFMKAWNSGKVGSYLQLLPVLILILKRDGIFRGKLGYIEKAIRKAIAANPRAVHLLSGNMLRRKYMRNLGDVVDAYGASAVSGLPVLGADANPGMSQGLFNGHRLYVTNKIRLYLNKYINN